VEGYWILTDNADKEIDNCFTNKKRLFVAGPVRKLVEVQENKICNSPSSPGIEKVAKVNL